MIRCAKCQSTEWIGVFKCIVDPANDKFRCLVCGTIFKRYDTPKESTPKDNNSGK